MNVLLVISFFICAPAMAESTCFGTTKLGRLDRGIKLPSEGVNFTSYSRAAELLGRTYVHSIVREIVIDSYTALVESTPGKVYKYAETGFKHGSVFKPHKTHQNGLSVDFMVPVINQKNQSVHLDTNVLNKWGYDIEFDQTGKLDNLKIDYEAMAAHIVELHKVAKHKGYDLWRVIFDPELQPYLLKTKYSKYLKSNIKFSKNKSWVRHDEHYHVDFSVPCKTLKKNRSLINELISYNRL